MPDHNGRLDTEQLSGMRGGAATVRHPPHTADQLVHAPEVGLQQDNLQPHDRSLVDHVLSGAKSLIGEIEGAAINKVNPHHTDVAQQGLIADIQKDLAAAGVPQLAKYKHAPTLQVLAKHVNGLAGAVNGAELTPGQVKALQAGLKTYSTQLDARIVAQQLQLARIVQIHEQTVKMTDAAKSTLGDMLKDIARKLAR